LPRGAAILAPVRDAGQASGLRARHFQDDREQIAEHDAGEQHDDQGMMRGGEEHNDP
jgi:hypothetical protein